MLQARSQWLPLSLPPANPRSLPSDGGDISGGQLDDVYQDFKSVYHLTISSISKFYPR